MEVEKPVMKGYLLFPPQGIVFNLTKKVFFCNLFELLINIIFVNVCYILENMDSEILHAI